MLTLILTIVAILLSLLLGIFFSVFNRPARRETVYICDTCNSQDCLCHKKR